MRALGTNKGILFLSGIIVLLYLSQYIFPELPDNTTPRPSRQEIDKKGLPDEIYSELTDKQVINELITFIDNYKTETDPVKTENSDIKTTTISYNGPNGDQFSKTYYFNQSKASYLYTKPSENIYNAASFYETGELMRRGLQNDTGKINVLFEKNGSVKEIENEGYY